MYRKTHYTKKGGEERISKENNLPNEDWKVTPSDQIRRYIVQLSKECIDHLSKSIDSNKEKYAFSVKTKALSLLLENYMEKRVKKITFDYFKKLEQEILEVKKRDDLSEETRKQHINKIRFEYMLPVMEQNIRLMQNSPIVEVEAHGTIDMSDRKIKDRIRGKEKALPVRDKRGGESNEEDEGIISIEDEIEEGESAFSFSDK